MLHPTVRLVLWGAAVAATQLMPLLWLLGVCAATFAAAGLLARPRFLLLLRRTRWLLASIALLFVFATPGMLLIPGLGSLSPTGEGMVLGVVHLLRLTLVLAALAILLQLTALDDLVAGLYGLMRPLAWLGLDRARVAVRLMLVLRYVEQAPRRGNWREWLEHSAGLPADAAPVRLRAAPLAPADYVVLACLGAVVALAAWRWA